MKKVEAIIRSKKFEAVRKALAEIGVNFFTFFEVKGYGLQQGTKAQYRGVAYDVGYIARLQLEILVADNKVEEIVNVISKAGKTGIIGDGKIIVSSVDHVYRIRTGETDSDAVN